MLRNESEYLPPQKNVERSRGTEHKTIVAMQRILASLVGFIWVCTYVAAAPHNMGGNAAAMPSYPEDSVTVLKGASVVAARKSSEDIVPHQKLAGRRLEGLSAHSVADAIRYFSGIQVKDYGGVGGLKTVDIRSMGTNHMGVFYDGIQLGNAQNGQIDLGKFSMDNIEEISLYNGQKSSIFQSAKDYGSAGTIYLHSRKPRFAEGKRRNLQLVYRTGSFGLQNPSFLWEEKLTDKLSSSLSAELIDATGKYRFRYRKVFSDGSVAWDTTATRQNGDIEALRIEGGLNGTFEGGKWNGKLYYYTSERGIPGAIVNNVWKRSQRQWDRNFFAQGSAQKQIGQRYEVMLNMKYAYDYMHYLNPDTTLLYIDNTFRQKEAYLSLANHYKINRFWDVALSTDYQRNSLDATLQNFVYPKRNTWLVAAVSTIDWRRLKVLGSILGTFIDENVTRIQPIDDSSLQPGTQSGTPNNFDAYTPALFISYKPLRDPAFCLRAFAKRIFRMPTFNDLYYTDIGNISLRPEYTTQYDLGVLYQKRFQHGLLRSIDAKADVYYNRVTDKIIAVPKGNGQYRWMMMNLGKVKIRGLDVSAQSSWQPLRDLTVNLCLNYTYQTARDYSDPTDRDAYGGTYKGQIAYIPWHNGSVTANAQYRTWAVNYSCIYVGERYHNSANIRANHEEPWYTHDLSLSKDFTFRTVSMSLTMECNNIFNQQYDVVLNYPMPGRNWKLIAKLKF